MLSIRLRRIGASKKPFFRVVVTEARTARDSSFVEVLGHYNPSTKPETLKMDRERLEHWLKAGAVPSDTVRTLVDRMPETPEITATAAATNASANSTAELSADASASGETPDRADLPAS